MTTTRSDQIAAIVNSLGAIESGQEEQTETGQLNQAMLEEILRSIERSLIVLAVKNLDSIPQKWADDYVRMLRETVQKRKALREQRRNLLQSPPPSAAP